MSLIKKLIQRLLDSRTTPAQAGNSAMPGATKTIFLSKDETVGSWGIINAGTAPDDGYLFVNASAEDNTNSEVRAQLGNLFHVSAQAPAPKGLGVAIPVSKGATYSVEGAFVSHITVGFVKVIGGGYNTIEKLIRRGGAICLSNLYNSLRRSSLQARRSGYRTSETRIIQKVSPCLCLTKGTISSMSHHVMGCLSWRKAAQARCTLSATAETIGSTLIRNILTPIIKDYLCKLIRAKQYLIKPRPITEAASAVVNSSLLCQDLNKLEGGASC